MEKQLAKHWMVPLLPNAPASSIPITRNLMPSGRCQSSLFVGTWRLRGDVIEFHLVKPGIRTYAEQFLFQMGQGPRPAQMNEQWKIVSVTEKSLSVIQLANGTTLDLIACPE